MRGDTRAGENNADNPVGTPENYEVAFWVPSFRLSVHYPSQCGGMLGGWRFADVKDGGFAEYFHVNNAAANLAPIPDGLTDEQAAYCCDMLSTGFVAAEHADIPIGGSVAIFSQGSVGLMATAGARLCGAGLVIGVECVPNREDLAKTYGCDVVVDFTKEDPLEAILKLTGGKGVDSAIEALGSAHTFAACGRRARAVPSPTSATTATAPACRSREWTGGSA